MDFDLGNSQYFFANLYFDFSYFKCNFSELFSDFLLNIDFYQFCFLLGLRLYFGEESCKVIICCARCWQCVYFTHLAAVFFQQYVDRRVPKLTSIRALVVDVHSIKRHLQSLFCKLQTQQIENPSVVVAGTTPFFLNFYYAKGLFAAFHPLMQLFACHLPDF